MGIESGSTRKHEGREPISERRIGGMLAAVGNHEGKALVLAGMQPGITYTQGTLKEVAKGPGRLLWSEKMPKAWVEQSMAPIGLVARQIVDTKRGEVAGYEKTELGEDIGTGLAGHLLDFSERHPDISLYGLFSATQTPLGSEESPDKLRPALKRYHIFSELITRENFPLTETALSQAIREKYPEEYIDDLRLRNHLTELSDQGIIDYEARKNDEPYSFFKTSDTAPSTDRPVFSTQRQLTTDVLAIMRASSKERLSRDDVYEAYLEIDSSKGDLDEKQIKRFKSTITVILKHLESEGYLEKAGKFNEESQSEINLSPEQRANLQEVVTIIEKVSSGDSEYLAEGREKARAILSDQSRFEGLMRKAREASPNVAKIPKDEQRGSVQAYIEAHPGQNNEEIFAGLQEEGTELTMRDIRNTTAFLLSEGALRAKKRKNRNYFEVANTEGDEGKTIFTRENLKQ